MKERGQGRPEGAPKEEDRTPQKEQAKPKGEGELSKFVEQQEEKYRLFRPYPPEWKEIDPVGQPYKAMTWMETDIGFRMREKAQDKVLLEKLASLRENIGKVSTAYAIIAYPFCKRREIRELIEENLESDTKFRKRTKVELNDEELELVGKLAAVRGLPFDPEKRVYEYSEVSGYPLTRTQKSSLFERIVDSYRCFGPRDDQ